ncbi:MAG: DUF4349 domain-containing protein [Myxococcota bacterium]|nr:DUF4349 domain-containing protein [Myxococcota bacterium]
MPPRTRSARAARFAAYALLGSMTLAACNKHADHRPSQATSAGAPAPAGDVQEARKQRAPVDEPLTLAPAIADRKVIRTGHISLVVGTYDGARAKLDALLQQAGGYVDSTQVHHHQGAVSSATLVLRIPAGAFATLLPALRTLGEIASESTNAEDVTDQYVDLAARLASAKVLEQRLLELAADRASGVEALLAVERELARVRGEIESSEGRLRQWNDQISLSTLTLSIATRAPAIAAAPAAGFGTRIGEGFHASIAALQDFGSWFVITLVAVLPWLILIVPGAVLGRRLWRRTRKLLPTAVARSVAPAPAAPPASEA